MPSTHDDTLDESGRLLVPVPALGWSNCYVSPPVGFVDGGRDPAGWDCWGLVRWVYEHELGLALPSHDDEYDSVNDSPALLRIFEAEREAWTQVEKPQSFDVAWISIAGRECHVGLVVEPGTLLHVLDRAGTRLVRTESPLWKRRIHGYYRHRALI